MVQSINEPQTPAFDQIAGAVKPTITAITPDTCAIGDADFTLDITGTGFGPDTIIFFAGHDEPTEFDGADTVSTGVKPSLWGSPVTVKVYVHNGTLHSDPVTSPLPKPAARHVPARSRRSWHCTSSSPIMRRSVLAPTFTCG
jgi:hypothetical protein